MCRVGWPPGRLTTPRSEKNTPRRNPVPSALAAASLAAKRLAKVAARIRSVRRQRLGAFERGEHPFQEAVAVARDRGLDPADVADVRPQAEDHPFARSTLLMPAAARRPAITFARWPRSRTSTSISTSMKSCWRLTILQVGNHPVLLRQALVISASAAGSLSAITLIRAVCALARPAASGFQSTSMKRSGVAAKPASVGQSRPWIVTPLPVATMPTIGSPGTGWQQPAK